MKQNGEPVPRTRSKTVFVISRIASFVFHPLLMTLFTAIILYKLVPDKFLESPNTEFREGIKVLLLYTVLFPFASILVLRLTSLISNARMDDAKDRILPLIATMIFYIFAYCYFIYKFSIPFFLQSLLLGSSSAIMIMFIINLFYKVSVHTTAAAILPGISIGLILNDEPNGILLLLLGLLIALVVGAIRWLLGAHSIGQILLGYLVGIVTQLAAYFI
jgi:hypothetical protein